MCRTLIIAGDERYCTLITNFTLERSVIHANLSVMDKADSRYTAMDGRERRGIAGQTEGLVTICVFYTLVVAGCSNISFYWYRSDRTLEEAKRDCLECSVQAGGEALWDISRYERLRRLGVAVDSPDYGASAGQLWLDANEAERRLEKFYRCMKSRGYLRIREDELGRGVRKDCGPLTSTYNCVAGR